MQYQPWTVNKYEILSRRKMLVREGIAVSPFPYSERHLQCAWYDRAYRPPVIFSAEGERLVIENPGRWNLEAGPDFLDAVIRVNDTQRIIRGDVELHVNPQDWVIHQHADDPRYSRVAAHVTYFTPTADFQKKYQSMMHIPLGETLKSYPSFCFDSIDTTAYPYHNISNDLPPCAQALRGGKLKSLDILLETAGTARLRVKASRILKAFREKNDEQVFYEEVLCALGYKNNKIGFRQLAQRVPLDALESECTTRESAYALLLGVAGLLPSPDKAPDEACRSFTRSLWDAWWRMDEKWKRRVMTGDYWNFSGQRPQNHPARRLAAASALFTGETKIQPLILSLDNNNSAGWQRRIRSLIRLKAQMPFWNHRLSFSSREREKSISLIGPQRTDAIITNVLVPYLIAKDLGSEELLKALPVEQSNSIIRQAAATLLGNDHNPALYNNGLKQQGLIQIFHDFCLNTRKGCGECTLAAALRVECGLLSPPSQRWRTDTPCQYC